MNLTIDTITEYLALVAAVSVAAEKLVEIIKTVLPKSLTEVNPDPTAEKRRQGIIQFISLLASVLTGVLLYYAEVISGFGIALTAGLLASGGSNLWNSLLGWAKGLKDIRQAEGREARLALKK